MISTLRGRVAARGMDYVVLEVGGVGFKVHVPIFSLGRLAGHGQEVRLFTHLHLRENDVSLYGFEMEEELALFRLLMTVSGIGPKSALAILSSISPDSFRTAVAQGDVGTLSKVPGIGKKTAEKLILHLRERIGAEKLVPLPPLSPQDADAVTALTALGYSLTEAREAVTSLPSGEMSVEERILLALRRLGGE